MIPVLHSLLETDLYKFTMWQTMLHRHPQAQAEYRFVCRNASGHPLATLLPELDAQLDHLCRLQFTEDELAYLAGLRYIKADFVDFLRIFRLQRRFVRAAVGEDGQTLEVVASGPQVHVMAFEIYVLAIVNELYFRRADEAAALAEGRTRLARKIERLRAFGAEEAAQAHARTNPFEFFDFGIRRRFSGAWQDEVVATLKAEVPEYFKGTSNVHLARKHGLVAIGTMAHDNHVWRGMDTQLQVARRMDIRLDGAESKLCSDALPFRMRVLFSQSGGASPRWAACLSTGGASASGSRWSTGSIRRLRRPSTGRGTSACAPWGARSAGGPVVHGRARLH